MNERIKNLWADALESGEYKQAQGKLTKLENGEMSHCCLGVLTELALKESVVIREIDDDIYVRYTSDSASEVPDGGFPPGSVVEWAQLDSHNPQFTLSWGEMRALGAHVDNNVDPKAVETFRATDLNDTWGLDFNAIATLVREQL